MSSKIIFAALIIIQCIYMQTALSRPDDRDKPIHITADTAELNDKTGISIYRGDVEMIQGTTILRGDVITIHSPDKKVNKVISIGNLATYQETTTDGHIVYAESEEMVYNRLESKIELFRRAKVTEEDNIFKSEHIVYFIEQELIDAGTSNDRVNITILPESKIFDQDESENIQIEDTPLGDKDKLDTAKDQLKNISQESQDGRE